MTITKASHLHLVKPSVKAKVVREPFPEQTELLDAPDWLSDDQKTSWDYAIANAPSGLLKMIDKSALLSFVIAEDLHKQATKEVARLGLIVKSPTVGAPVQNPYLPIINKQSQIMIKAASQLGFTPTSRSRVKITKGQGGRKNPFTKIAETES